MDGIRLVKAVFFPKEYRLHVAETYQDIRGRISEDYEILMRGEALAKEIISITENK